MVRLSNSAGRISGFLMSSYPNALNIFLQEIFCENGCGNKKNKTEMFKYIDENRKKCLAYQSLSTMYSGILEKKSIYTYIYIYWKSFWNRLKTIRKYTNFHEIIFWNEYLCNRPVLNKII